MLLAATQVCAPAQSLRSAPLHCVHSHLPQTNNNNLPGQGALVGIILLPQAISRNASYPLNTASFESFIGPYGYDYLQGPLREDMLGIIQRKKPVVGVPAKDSTFGFNVSQEVGKEEAF